MASEREHGWHSAGLVHAIADKHRALTLWQRIGMQALLLCVPIGVLSGW